MSYNYSLNRIAKLLPGIGDQPKTTYLDGIGEKVKSYKQGLGKELKTSKIVPEVALPSDKLSPIEAHKIMRHYSGNYDYLPINKALRTASTPKEGYDVFKNDARWQENHAPKSESILQSITKEDVDQINSIYENVYGFPAFRQIDDDRYASSENFTNAFDFHDDDKLQAVLDKKKLEFFTNLHTHDYLDTFNSIFRKGSEFNISSLPKKRKVVPPSQETIDKFLAEHYVDTVKRIPAIESVLRQQPTYLDTIPTVVKDEKVSHDFENADKLRRGVKFFTVEDKEKYLTAMKNRKRQNQFTSATTKPEVLNHFRDGNSSVQHLYLQDGYQYAHDALNPLEGEFIFPPGTYFHAVDRIDLSPEHTLVATRAIENPEITIKKLQAQGINPSLADRIKIKRYAMGLYPPGTNLADVKPPAVGG